MRKFLLFLCFTFSVSLSLAGTIVNTTGSDDNTAISGFDAVAFFTEKKAVQGKPELEYKHLGASWHFASQENLQAFIKNPEKFMPEWGGQCAWCISENCISNKKLSGSFDLIDGKLYLFAHGNSSPDGARNGFWQTGGGSQSRIQAGEKYWVEIQKKLADDTLKQRNATNYRKTKFD